VATLLQVSVKTVYRLAADPTFPAFKLPGRNGSIRVNRERLLRWLRDREQGRGSAQRQHMAPVLPLKSASDKAVRSDIRSPNGAAR
jgi:excisionase family DNA binding protein